MSLGSKDAALAGEVSCLSALDRVVFLVALHFVGVCDLLALDYGVSEGHLVGLGPHLYYVALAVFAEVYKIQSISDI